MTKSEDLSPHLLKVMDDHVKNVPYYTKLISGEVELGKEYGAYVEQIRRIEEVKRILDAVQDAFNELDKLRIPFITLYYFGGRGVTVEAAGQRVGASRSSAVRWRRDFIEAICKKLGWI
ncbi:hypothetical protein M3152_08395 [Sporosarcina luteola]|uniref:hypothetical protein n=1 Tax=Sporosarcina luteola TaxID=582850 RepID=UPI002040693E|nr:hypothetical protein [Sporosarcina luteola]MCM3637739.1 hypothetical protein [Sporosarcina luteola]